MLAQRSVWNGQLQQQTSFQILQQKLLLQFYLQNEKE